MAVRLGVKRKWDDDLIPTIDTDDEVPDLDGDDNDEDDVDTYVNSAKGETSGLRRPTDIRSKADTKDQTKPNDSKPVSTEKRKKRKVGSTRPASIQDEEETDEEDDSWASQRRKAAGFDPTFVFEDPGAAGDIEEGFGSWVIPGNEDDKGVRKPLSIDEIVKRRKRQTERAKANLANGVSTDIEVDQSTENGARQATSDKETKEDVESTGSADSAEQHDELLAEDGFGMGASQGDEEESLVEEDDAFSHSDNDEDRQLQQDEDEDGKESEDEQSGDEVARPVAHPDDEIADGLEDDTAGKVSRLDEREEARREAFFAPSESIESGGKPTKTSSSFQTMSLSRPILKGLTAVGFTSPTPIQAKTVPVALMGKDVVGGAVTGSGKTAAFILPILERLLFRPKKILTTRVAILMPTRELAVQCHNVSTKLAQFTDITFALIVGGLSLREQEQTLKKRPDVVIATPGRFIDHMRNSASFAVENIEILVLDEADRMLEDGFADELNEVLKTIPRSRQTMLFSATMTQDVDQLIRVGLNRPIRLLVDAPQQTVTGLVQEFVRLKPSANDKRRPADRDDDDSLQNYRLATLLRLCSSVYTTKTIIFIPTKLLAHRTKVLFSLNNIAATELHGSMSQQQRLEAISGFRDGRVTHLLATDLASRGLDIPRVDTVINFTVPSGVDTYLHRVGRTARAGRKGVACTIFSAAKASRKTTSKGQKTPPTERARLKPILRLAKSQRALIRTRTLQGAELSSLAEQVHNSQPEIDAILEEEKEERLIAQTERDMMKGENLVKYEDEIRSRPRRTWFQSEKAKRDAKALGKEQRLGLGENHTNGAGKQSSAVVDKSKKRRLSGKEKKRLDQRDERQAMTRGGWKKRAQERGGKGVIETEENRKKSAREQRKNKKREDHRDGDRVQKNRVHSK